MPRLTVARLSDLTPTHASIMSDRVQDEFGAPSEWLGARDFAFLVSQNDGRAWHYALGGNRPCACTLKDEGSKLTPEARAALLAEFVRQLDGLSFWCVKFVGYEFGWLPYPVLPYRYLYAILAAFGIRKPDTYLRSNANHVARRDRSSGLVRVACAADSRPFVGRTVAEAVEHMMRNGLRLTGKGYEFARTVVGWDNRKPLKRAISEFEREKVVTRPCFSCNGRGMFVCHACADTGRVSLRDEEY